MWRRIFAKASSRLGISAASGFSRSVTRTTRSLYPDPGLRESSTFENEVALHPWTRNYQRHNGNKWRYFARSASLLPAVLAMAAPIYHEETDMEESDIMKTRDEAIIELLRKAKRMLDTKCSLESVEKAYKDALHLALTKKDSSAIAYVQDMLANFYLRHGQLKEADDLFRRVIRNLLDSGVAENHVAVIEISLKLATIYASAKNDELATTGYEWVVEKCRKNLENLKNSPKTRNFESDYKNQIALLGMALDSYGRYLYMSGKYDRALDVTKEACEISKELFGEGDVRTLVILNDLGAILNTKGQFDEAEQMIEKAITAAARKKDVDHADIAIFWVNLSSVYKNHGKLDKMLQAFENARKEATLAKNRSLQRQVEQNIEIVENM